MGKYKVYVNAGIEILEEIEAGSEEEARDYGYSLVADLDCYNLDVDVEEVK